MHVTSSTISNDLDKLEPWLGEQGLRLLRKPGLGVSLLGDERDLRRAIVRYIYEHVGEERLLNVMQDNLPDDDASVAQVSKFLLDLIDAGEWRRLEQMIRVTENDLGYKLSDNAFIGLVVHLSLAVRRIKNHEAVTVDEHICSNLRGSRSFTAAKKLAEKISAALKIDVPDSEICYITMHILGARSRYSSASLGTISMMDNYRLVGKASHETRRKNHGTRHRQESELACRAGQSSCADDKPPENEPFATRYSAKFNSITPN